MAKVFFKKTFQAHITPFCSRKGYAGIQSTTEHTNILFCLCEVYVFKNMYTYANSSFWKYVYECKWIVFVVDVYLILLTLEL